MAPTSMLRRLVVALATVMFLGALAPVGMSAGPRLVLVRVPVRDAAEAAVLLSSFDETHAHRPGSVELLLWPGDAQRLAALGFDYEIEVADVVARDAAELSGARPRQDLPGPDRSDYRHLGDYEAEMKALASDHPDLVELLKLPQKTLEGRRIFGVVIAAPAKATDGRPYFHIDGVHHAREWPAGEFPMIYAHYLVDRFGKDPAVTRLLRSVKVEIVPIVNVDGFDYAREALLDPQGFASEPNQILGLESYWRKNRRSFSGITAAAKNPDAYGVDVNRNYGFLWGDDEGGSSGDRTDQTYRGEAPFSEPEAADIRDLVSTRQVTGLITNHTYGDLVLRPWGHTSKNSPDERLMARLGDRMALAMGGYSSRKGIGLYATTGTTDDWAYAATSALGYTFEHGNSFHGAYADAVGRHYKGVMKAFMIMGKAAADPAFHSVVRGRVVDGHGKPVPARLRLTKVIRTPLWPGNPTGHKYLEESLLSKLSVGRSGRFAWHVNPSTRPESIKAGKTERYQLEISSPRGGCTSKRMIEVGRGDVLDLGTVRLTGCDEVSLVVVNEEVRR